ncbi:MAG: hypothetical protein DI598_09160 [Pseudopedobacter saltans]|uniref:Uncharacterized protein n=1 Tax=Pseudopedobacter saltans TaxID=151895 RepID=A0A2W5GZM5_9SPHI|nr:MAG: hypothetical protein DI598_09160 [Pseudopedobacter saltans]
MRLFISLTILFLINGNFASGQQKQKYNLGDGVVIVQYKNYEKNFKLIVLYKDSSCKIPFIKLLAENTNCPTCFGCAEPTHYYKGPIKPFSCNLMNGIVFVGRKCGNNAYQIFTDRSGTVAYIAPNVDTKYYTWSQYMNDRSNNGDYFLFVRQWDSTVIYNKKYSLKHLPKPNRSLQVGTHIKDIDYVKFYPMLVDGYWMKLKAKRNDRTIGYYWVIWRNETEWLVGFKFDPN